MEVNAASTSCVTFLTIKSCNLHAVMTFKFCDFYFSALKDVDKAYLFEILIPNP